MKIQLSSRPLFTRVKDMQVGHVYTYKGLHGNDIAYLRIAGDKLMCLRSFSSGPLTAYQDSDDVTGWVDEGTLEVVK